MKTAQRIFVLLWLGATGFARAADPHACSVKQLASVDISVGADIRVPVEFHGQTLWMVLDLGAPFSLVWQSAVEALRLQSEKLQGPAEKDWLTIGGRQVTASATVDSLSIGGYRISRRTFYVDPKTHSNENQPNQIVLGSLGSGELWSVDFELDLPRRRLSLYSPKHCPGPAVNASDYRFRIPMELNELGNMVFPIELNGSKIEAGISTMNDDTVMSTDVSRLVFGFDEHSPDVEARVDDSGRPHEYFRAMTLTSGELTLSNVLVRLTPPVKKCTLSKTGMFGDVPEFKGRDDHLCYGVYPILLGKRTLEHVRVYFSAAEKTIYFTTPEVAE
jgi:hypothetical protein